MACAIGRAAAEPIATGPGIIDDRVVKAATICAITVLETAKVEVSPKGTVKEWCDSGDFVKLSKNADVLLAMAAICNADITSELPGDDHKADRERVDAACHGKGNALTRDDALKLSGLASASTGVRKGGGDRQGVSATPSEAVAGAVTTTTDIVARAVASFLEKRAKAEFKEFILRRLRRKVCDDLKLQPWVPNTCAYLGSAEDDTTLPLSLGTGLRSALLQDAAELPDHVIANLLTPKGNTRGGADLLLTRVGFETTLSLLRHRDPSYVAAILVKLANDSAFCPNNDDGCHDIKTLLAIVGRTIAVISSGQLGTVGNIKFEFAAPILIGQLQGLEQELTDHGFGFKFTNLLPTDADGKLRQLLDAAKALADATQELDTTIKKAIDKTDDEKAHFRDVANQTAAVIGQVEVVVEATSDLIANTDANAKVKAKLADLDRQLDYARSLVAALAQADLARTVALVLTQIAADKNIQTKIPGAVSRVLSFAVDLATAKDSKEAEAVIEGIAAPVGAWQGKLEDTVFSISGFVGGALGYESTRAEGADVKSQSIGPMAALGFDINAPGKLCGFFHDWVRPGLFLSVIDVGALMSYAYDTPATTSANDKPVQAGQTTPIGFAQIFSPGAFLRLGIAKTPLVIGGGVSFLPRGRSITTTDNAMTTTTEERSAVRWSLFLAVDVTILPF